MAVVSNTGSNLYSGLTDFVGRFREGIFLLLEDEDTSGRAGLFNLEGQGQTRLATALAPKRVVPIHSFAGHRFAEYFAGVDQRDDGTWWEA